MDKKEKISYRLGCICRIHSILMHILKFTSWQRLSTTIPSCFFIFKDRNSLFIDLCTVRIINWNMSLHQSGCYWLQVAGFVLAMGAENRFYWNKTCFDILKCRVKAITCVNNWGIYQQHDYMDTVSALLDLCEGIIYRWITHTKDME